MDCTTTLYALGSNGSFQLGIGHEDDVSSPQKCRFMVNDENSSGSGIVEYIPLDVGEQITKIVAGGNHTLLLTTHGHVWATGLNEDGQLGCTGQEVGTENTAAAGRGTWKRVQWHREGQSEAVKFTDVAATWMASFFVVNGHSVFSCGRGNKGELGLGVDRCNASTLTPCFDLHEFEPGVPEGRIMKVSGCVNHVVGLSSSGELYGWGACRKGQLGVELKDEKVVWIPQRLIVDLKWKPKQVATGREFTLVVGDTPAEQCFLGDAGRMGFETPVLCDADSKHDFEVYAGWTHVVLRKGDGSLCGFGRSQRGQLLVRQSQRRIASFVMGSEHSLAVIDDGSVIAWGWGEHGNCGAEVDERKNVKARYNTIFAASYGQRVAGVGAGCATSFFWIESRAPIGKEDAGSNLRRTLLP